MLLVEVRKRDHRVDKCLVFGLDGGKRAVAEDRLTQPYDDRFHKVGRAAAINRACMHFRASRHGGVLAADEGHHPTQIEP